jgi:energy-coupling factor transport system permease protein
MRGVIRFLKGFTMRDTFSTYHPIINFTYFFAVILFSMIFLHPILLGISMTGAFVYSLFLNGKRGLRFILFFVLPMMLVAGMVNPLFNHRGATILGYLRDNPITLESILYGVAVGVMFGTVLLWFSCYNTVMTSDKFMYIFGKIMPALSLIFSMVLRFVPRFRARIQVISNGRKCLGRDMSGGNLRERIQNGIKILSIMITWSLENAIETADSMRARGYGLPGRTSFSIYRFDTRDKGIFVCLLIFIMYIGIGGILGWNVVQYFPSFYIIENGVFSILGFTIYFLLCFTPIIINLWEGIRWKYLQSRI